jgi:hypothetical protein
MIQKRTKPADAYLLAATEDARAGFFVPSGGSSAGRHFFHLLPRGSSPALTPLPARCSGRSMPAMSDTEAANGPMLRKRRCYRSISAVGFFDHSRPPAVFPGECRGG